MNNITEELICNQRDAEWCFCALAMMHTETTVQTCGWLSPDVFVTDELKKFWKGILEHGEALRAATDVDRMLATQLYRRAIDISYNIQPEEYARLIMEGNYYVSTVLQMEEMSNALIAKNHVKVQQIAGDIHNKLPYRDVSVFDANDVDAEFRAEISGSSSSKAVMSYMPDLDNILGGFFPGDLTLLAGRPSTGKSAVALQIARNVARNGKKVLFFSLEMQRIQLWARMACGMTKYPWRDVRSGRVDKAGIAEISAASQKLQSLYGDRLMIQDEVFNIVEMNQIVAKHKPDLVIIDHLGEIAWSDPTEKELIWYGRATKYVRQNIARRLHVPVILLHQLSRAVETRNDKRPILSDLRWSGELEQLADTVMMTYRDDFYTGTTIPSTVTRVPFELWIRKNRQGSINGVAMMIYDLKAQWFFSMPSASGGGGILAPTNKIVTIPHSTEDNNE